MVYERIIIVIYYFLLIYLGLFNNYLVWTEKLCMASHLRLSLSTIYIRKKTNVHFLERKLTVKHRQNFALSRSSKVQLGERDSADDIEKPTIK